MDFLTSSNKAMMQRIFWTISFLQTLMILVYAIQWPGDAWVWFSGFALYVVTCIGLMWVGVQIAKQDKVYYLVTVATVSCNWIISGTVGVLVSSLLGALNLHLF